MSTLWLTLYYKSTDIMITWWCLQLILYNTTLYKIIFHNHITKIVKYDPVAILQSWHCLTLIISQHEQELLCKGWDSSTCDSFLLIINRLTFIQFYHEVYTVYFVTFILSNIFREASVQIGDILNKGIYTSQLHGHYWILKYFKNKKQISPSTLFIMPSIRYRISPGIIW